MISAGSHTSSWYIPSSDQPGQVNVHRNHMIVSDHDNIYIYIYIYIVHNVHNDKCGNLSYDKYIYIIIYNVVISDSWTLRIILCMRGYLCPQIILGYSASPPLGQKNVSTYKPPQITVSPRKYGSKHSTVPNIKIVGRHQDVLWTPSKTGPQGLTDCHSNRHVPMLIGRIPLSVVNPHDWWSNPEHVWTSQVSDFRNFGCSSPIMSQNSQLSQGRFGEPVALGTSWAASRHQRSPHRVFAAATGWTFPWRWS